MIKRSARRNRPGAIVQLFGGAVSSLGAAVLILGVTVSGALGCAEGVDPDATHEWQTSANDLKAKRAAEQEYFLVRPDYRKCASPLCGGYFAKAVNRRWTRCADGTFARECYVAELEYDDALPSADHVLVRGAIESNVFPDFGDLGRLEAEQTWGSATSEEPTGAFFRVSDSGIVCITTPCPTIQLERLNTRRNRTVSVLDLKPTQASEEQLQAAEAAFDAGELIVSGRARELDPEFGPTLFGSQIFLPAANESCKSDDDCSDGAWCRQTEAGAQECVPFVTAGQSCNGFTLPWYYERCAPELVCDVPDYVADAPGICRVPCEDNTGCSDEEFCASGVCRGDGSCENAGQCLTIGNEWPHIACVGYPTCPLFGDGEQCGWTCGAPQCMDVRGMDFGPCDATLGYGVYFDQCVALSGCDSQGLVLFESLEECQTLCEQ